MYIQEILVVQSEVNMECVVCWLWMSVCDLVSSPKRLRRFLFFIKFRLNKRHQAVPISNLLIHNKPCFTQDNKWVSVPVPHKSGFIRKSTSQSDVHIDVSPVVCTSCYAATHYISCGVMSIIAAWIFSVRSVVCGRFGTKVAWSNDDS